MDLDDYSRAVRRGLPLITLATLAGLLLALLAIASGTPTYRSEAQVLVSGGAGAGDVDNSYTGSLVVRQRMASYVAVASTPAVMDGVRGQLAVPDDPASLAARVDASNPPDTSMIVLGATGSSPADAQRLLNAVVEQFTAVVRDLEQTRADAAEVVRLTVVGPPSLPGIPTGPADRTVLALGLGTGLLIGLGAAVVRARFDTSLQSVAETERALRLPVLAEVTGNRLWVSAREPGGYAELEPAVVALMHRWRNSGRPHRVLLTSAGVGEGSSQVARGLAEVLARSGRRVVLLRATPGSGAGQPAVGGAGRDGLRVVDAPLEDVSVIPRASWTRWLDDDDPETADIVVDAPPLAAGVQAQALASTVPQVLLVASSRTSRTDVRGVLRALGVVDAEVLGLVLVRGRPGGDHRWPNGRGESSGVFAAPGREVLVGKEPAGGEKARVVQRAGRPT